ncbi:hypothetical protein GCM10009841_06100 [Microlunatus panaciterrae]|uniref:Uncharacterized protein YdhG (YjbR/CyaY superfamily) n=1 Tax=Microlunatus panaciterrae TaxID=400768 RepID=A0ABS2RIB7_9ACTN|nr:DUF1801 domain-containing protein [Microlunatus panaciterrae]MBM7798735.1 uncharacterized protein YdhG (YjbR/CyaY superfamily) [Microlunatus panaciterrae]
MATAFATVDEYIASFSGEIGERLRRIRQITREVVPQSGERISYAMPTVTLGGQDLLFYSGWKRHVGLYPVPSGDEALARDLGSYRSGKGTLQFRLDQPFPDDLVRRVVAALASERTGSI